MICTKKKEAQRARANDIGKSDGKNVTMARQLDFSENQLAQMDTCRDMLLGLVLDKPAPPVSLPVRFRRLRLSAASKTCPTVWPLSTS